MDAPNNSDSENGMTYATLLVGIIAFVAQFATITFGLYIVNQMANKHREALHAADNNWAIQLTWSKNQFNHITTKCDEKMKKIEDWNNWAKTVNAKPPFELTSSSGDCRVSEMIPTTEHQEQ
jgi:hypothetical protein